ncbi:hypothetical protein [Aminobacter sp. MET-1]|uniref:hypothetical protein n=1 Tax=Aminobacter sp. MET-1 TaxID=2951085 RepID=UPI00226A1A8A|nr:hypothetical protein [Aminobacter sp. MET-1]MCX8570740.1 hypothetical protein [Aminobacter sp. MET-1]
MLFVSTPETHEMTFPDILQSPLLSREEKVARLRELEANVRSLDRALSQEGDSDSPWAEQLVEIENEIRFLTNPTPSASKLEPEKPSIVLEPEGSTEGVENADQREGS